MYIREVMQEVAGVEDDVLVTSVAQEMQRKNVSSMAVFHSGCIVGMVTERDMLRKIISPGKDPLSLRVRDIMSRELISIEADRDIEDAGAAMEQAGTRRLLVTDRGRIVGKITADGIARNLRYLVARRMVSSPLQSGMSMTYP
ncbi:CBS domain-containing protein [Candidatus Woesearchaeota archaeon]|nr:CBS domain-containing protein [Candidatus Woesearchaeota archaeon]